MIDFDIVVVANYHRKPLILDHLGGIPHKVSYTPDYPLLWSKKRGVHLQRSTIGSVGEGTSCPSRQPHGEAVGKNPAA
jgi:hypothetical protein